MLDAAKDTETDLDSLRIQDRHQADDDGTAPENAVFDPQATHVAFGKLVEAQLAFLSFFGGSGGRPAWCACHGRPVFAMKKAAHERAGRLTALASVGGVVLLFLLDELDLVAIRIGDEGDHGLAVLHRAGFAGDRAALGLDRVAGGIGVIDLDGDVAVASPRS
jgi:hypothetical protein